MKKITIEEVDMRTDQYLFSENVHKYFSLTFVPSRASFILVLGWHRFAESPGGVGGPHLSDHSLLIIGSPLHTGQTLSRYSVDTQ